MSRRSARFVIFAATIAMTLVLSPIVAHADDPSFGPYDISTLFFIDKSDDKNRVDYGMHLDEHCWPRDGGVFPYWREFERAPPVRIHGLNLIEPLAYGVTEQKWLRRTAAGSEYAIKLKQFERWIYVSTSKEPNGRCAALTRTSIAGVAAAELLSVHVTLAGVLSVAYVDLKGKNLESGQLVEERLKK